MAGDHVVQILSRLDRLSAEYRRAGLPGPRDILPALVSCDAAVRAVTAVPVGRDAPLREVMGRALEIEPRVRAACLALQLRCLFDGDPRGFPEFGRIDDQVYIGALVELSDPTGFFRSRLALYYEQLDSTMTEARNGHSEAMSALEGWLKWLDRLSEPSLPESIAVSRIKAEDSLDRGLQSVKAGESAAPLTSPQLSVFISYRRSDSEDFTARLSGSLKSTNVIEVMLDIDSIQLGVDFRESIRSQIERADYVLVVIGDDWLDAADGEGRARLELSNDPVRVEIETALALEKRIVPILANDAKLPAEDELPESVRHLCYRNGFEIRHRSFARDADELVRQMVQGHQAGGR